MGKRKKSSRGPQKKQKQVLPTNFSCLFCNHEKSVSVKLDKKAGIGELSCKICAQQFQTGINYLSAPVDVYSDWIDACDAVAKDAVTSNEVDDGMNPYEDMVAGNERQNSEIHMSHNTMNEVGNGEFGQGGIDEDD